MQHNPKDPLNNRPPAARELFQRFSREANGFPFDASVEAALNVILNALRQQHKTQKAAGDAFDEMAAKAKSLLMEHYDRAGTRRNIFPHHQTVVMPPVHQTLRTAKPYGHKKMQ